MGGPTNPMLNIIDIAATAKVAKKHGILLGVDNTLLLLICRTPWIWRGPSYALVTKYLGGHSDIVMGALMLNDDTLAEHLYFLQTRGAPDPWIAF